MTLDGRNMELAAKLIQISEVGSGVLHASCRVVIALPTR
jgi:hypothetical protein